MGAVGTADSVADALSASIDALGAAGVDSPRLDAEILLASATGRDRAQLLTEPDAGVEPAAARAFGQMVRRRLRREPVSYILGRRWFRDLELEVDRRALIPRPETELLVEVALERQPRRVLDVGTGCGAVALAVAGELADSEVTATDISEAALELAGRNAARLGLSDRVRLLTGMLPQRLDFDLLLANLPYVAESEWDELEPEVREWEPREALVAGPDGLAAIRELLAALAERAADGERVTAIALEVGARQAAAVRRLIAEAGFPRTEVRTDLAGIERVVVGLR
jgi:release factor glutamine methyltransferase